MSVVLILFCAFLIALIYNLKATFTYWNKFNIPQHNNKIQQLWSTLTNWRLSHHMMQLYTRCRKNNWDCIGSYHITRPILFIASPKLLKEITVNHQKEFCNRGSYHSNKSLTDRNLFNMKNETWCQWRKIMSTCFSPNKMKQYMNIFNSHLPLNALDPNKTNEAIDFFELTNNYSSGIAEFIFLGVKIDKETKETTKMLDGIFRPKKLNKLIDILSYYWPELLQMLNAPEFPSAVQDQVKLTLKATLDNGDFLDESMVKQLYDLGAKISDKGATIQEENIIGVLSALFIGGLKSTTPFLTYACYELAKSATVQERLRLEIQDFMDDNGNVSYDDLKNMTYMHCILNEVMRLYNGGPLLIRECNQTCTLDNGVTIEKGVLVISSLRGILMDNEYFPDPDKFDPDRFLNDAHQDVFYPFGMGRHICIGQKFALFQAKLFLCWLLTKYTLSVNEKTENSFKDKNARLACNAIYLNATPVY